MTDTMKPVDSFSQAVEYMELALAAFKRGLQMQTTEPQPAEPVQDPPKPVEVVQDAPEPPKEPEINKSIAEPPTVDEVRKVFSQILLDNKVNGNELVRAALNSQKARKLSEVSPDNYLALLIDVVDAYGSELTSADPAGKDEKLRGMDRWQIPF